MPPTGSKRTRTEAVAVPKGDQIIAAWLTGVLEPRTNVAAAQRLAYPTETVFSAPYVTHIAVRIEQRSLSLFGQRRCFAIDTVCPLVRLRRTSSTASCVWRVSRVS